MFITFFSVGRILREDFPFSHKSFFQVKTPFFPFHIHFFHNPGRKPHHLQRAKLSLQYSAHVEAWTAQIELQRRNSRASTTTASTSGYLQRQLFWGILRQHQRKAYPAKSYQGVGRTFRTRRSQSAQGKNINVDEMLNPTLQRI